MSFFSSPPIDLSRGRGRSCLVGVDPRVIRSLIGAESDPYSVVQVKSDDGLTAILSLKATGVPIWAYASQIDKGRVYHIWIYLQQVGLPIYAYFDGGPGASVGQWTNASRYAAQSAEPAEAELLETVDLRKGIITKSGPDLFVADAFDISEIALDNAAGAKGPITGPIISVKADKGLSHISFDPEDIVTSLGGSKAGLSASESKGLPLPPLAPVVFPPPPSSSPPVSSSPSWLAIGGAVAVATAAVVVLGDYLSVSARSRL